MTINVRHLFSTMCAINLISTFLLPCNKKKYNNFILILEYNSSNDVIKSTGRTTEDANRTQTQT